MIPNANDRIRTDLRRTPVDKSFYRWLIAVLALITLSGVTQVVIRSQIGTRFYFLDAFDGWFVTSNIAAVMGSILLLIYYHRRKFRFVFGAGIISLFWMLVNVILFYFILRWHAPAGLRPPLLILYLISGIVYGISLVFLRAANVRWLRVAGGYVVLLSLAFLVFLVWSLVFPVFRASGTAQRLSNWMEWAACLTPVAYMLHFITESRPGTAREIVAEDRRPMSWLLQVATAVCLVLMVTFLLGLSFES